MSNHGTIFDINLSSKIDYKKLVLILVFLVSVVGVGLLISYSNWLAIIALLPAVLWLLFKPDWALYLFVASLPLELILQGDILSLPKILGFLAILSWLISLGLHQRSVRWDLPLFLMVSFILLGILSIGWTIDQSKTREAILTYIQLAILYFLLSNNITNAKELKQTMYALAAGGIILILSGVYQFVTGEYLNALGGRLTGISNNANSYVLWGLAVIPGLYMLGKRSRGFALVSMLSILSLCITALFTQSRGGLFSVIGFFMVLLFFRTSRWRAIPIVLLVGLIVWQLAPGSYWIRFTEIGNNGIDRIRDLWPAGWQSFLQSPLLGKGLGTSEIVIGNMVRVPSGSPTLSVHSAPLAVAMEVGLIGILIYLAFMIIPFFALLKSINSLGNRKNSWVMNLAIVVAATYVSFLISWFKGGGLEFSKLLWLLLGLSTGISTVIMTIPDNQPTQTR